jgi:hypothetical protein
MPRRKMADRRDWSQGFRNSGDVAAGCQYVRWMANGKGEKGPALLVLAIGVNSIAASLAPDLDPEDALELLQAEVETIAELLRGLRATKKTNGAKPRGPR